MTTLASPAALDAPGAARPRFRALPGHAHPLGATPDEGGTNFALLAQHATAVQLLVFASHDDPEPIVVIDLDPDRDRSFYLWHVYVTDVRPGMGYAYRVDGSRDVSGGGHRFDPHKVLVDPYARAVTSSVWDRAAACRPGDNVASSLRGVVVDLRGYDWEGDRAAGPADGRDGHLRDARRRVHEVTHLAGDPSRAPSAASSRRSRTSRSWASPRVELLPVFEFDALGDRGDRARSTGERLTQLLGLQPHRVLQPRLRLLHQARGRGPCRGVPRHGQGAPPGRHRGHPRRRLQPHRRGQRRRPHDQLPRARQRHLLPARAVRQAVLHELSAAAATRSTATIRWSTKFIVDCLDLLGPRAACRWLPLRPRVDPVARPGRRADGRSAGPLEHRARERAGPDEAHRRGVGRGRPLPGRLLPGLPLGRVERSLPGRHPPVPEGRHGSRRRGRIAHRRQRRPVPGRRRAAHQQHQLHHLPTTASPSTTWSRTTTSTTRPTARATATAATTT